MDWKDEIRSGMEMIKSGCSKNSEWSQCTDCPFDFYRQALIDKAYSDDKADSFDAYQPMNWLEDEEHETM